MPFAFLHLWHLGLTQLLLLLLLLVGVPLILIAVLVYGVVVIFRRQERPVSILHDERREGDS